MNHVTLIAALTRDPEVRYTPDNLCIFEATVAGERQIIDSYGQPKTLPFYEQVQALGKKAELLAERGYVAGQALYLEGALDYSTWQTSEGQNRSVIRTKITGEVYDVQGEVSVSQDQQGGYRLQGGMSEVTVVGNLGSDAELRYTPAGDAVLELRLAISEYWRDANGQRQDRTHWVNATLWREMAEAHAGLKKGDTVMVRGAFLDERWTDKENRPRRQKKVEVAFIVPLGRRRSAQAPARQARTAQQSRPAPQRQPVAAAASAKPAAPARKSRTTRAAKPAPEPVDDFPADAEGF